MGIPNSLLLAQILIGFTEIKTFSMIFRSIHSTISTDFISYITSAPQILNKKIMQYINSLTTIINKHISRTKSDTYLNLIAVIIPFVIYLITMSKTIYGLDSAELTTGSFTLGIVHAPGSPLFLLFGRLFSFIPFGDIGFRVNLVSAVSATLAIYFLFRILLYISTDQVISLFTCLLFAFSYYFWISALAAELYAMQAMFIALSIFLALEYSKTKKNRYLYLLAFFFTLGLGNHISIILFAPGLIYLILIETKVKDIVKQLPLLSLLAILGFSIYLYLPIRFSANPALNYANSYWNIDLTTIEGFLWMLSGKMFNSLFWAYGLNDLPSELATYFHQLWSNYFGLGLILGVIGFLYVSKTNPKLNLGFLLMLIGYLAFYLPYGAVDKEFMFLPSHLIWSIWIGLGFLALKKWSKSIQPSFEKFSYNVLILLVVSGFLFNLSYVDISNDSSAREIGEKIFSSIESNSLYFGSWFDIPILEYLQIVEGEREDVTIRNLVFMSKEDSTKLAREKITNRKAVYTSSSHWFEESIFYYQSIPSCNCYRLFLKTNN